MEKIKSFLKSDGNKFTTLLIALTVGLALIILGNTNNASSKENEAENINTPEKSLSGENEIVYSADESYERILEKRLEETLSLISGAGKVKVMVKLNHSGEIVLSQDKNINENIVSEDDGEGGLRETRNYSEEIKNIIITEGGKQKPLILKEIEPTVSGVIVIAQGGGAANVKEQLINAVVTVLGVETHRVEVLKMK